MDYSKVGKIRNTHGLEGNVIIKHDFEGVNVFKNLDHIFIELLKGSFIPYFIGDKKQLDKTEVLIKLEEVDSVEEARFILNKEVWIEKELFKKIKPKNVDLDFVGFSIIDLKFKNLGKIEQLMEMPKQVLAVVTYQGKEVLIPLIDQTIISIDPHKKEIHVDLPEGLLGIYL